MKLATPLLFFHVSEKQNLKLCVFQQQLYACQKSIRGLLRKRYETVVL